MDDSSCQPVDVIDEEERHECKVDVSILNHQEHHQEEVSPAKQSGSSSSHSPTAPPSDSSMHSEPVALLVGGSSSSEVCSSSDGGIVSPSTSDHNANNDRDTPNDDDKDTTDDKNDNHDGIISVRCGSLQARMHLHRFMCPGIHQPCIEFDKEFYTPKQFTVVAAKDKQKDWKGSIKYQRVPLRQLMERKQLDFYRHDTYCSGKCASKNYRAYRDAISTSTNCSNQPSSTPMSPSVEYLHNMQAAAAAGLFSRKSSTCDSFDSCMSNYPDLTTQLAGQLAANAAAAVKREPSTPPHPLHQPTQNDIASALARFGMLGTALNPHMNLAALQGAMGMPSLHHNPTDPSSIETSDSLMLKNPLVFWEGVLHLGLFDDLVNEVATTFEKYKSTFANNPEMRPKIAAKLSGVVAALKIPENLRRRLQTKRMINKAERDMLASEVQELRKRAEEQNRRQLEAKRKSEIFDQLFSTYDQPAAKSPKLQNNGN